MENPVKRAVKTVFRPIQNFRKGQVERFRSLLEGVSVGMEFATDDESTRTNRERLRGDPRVDRVFRVVNRIFWGSFVAGLAFDAGLIYLGNHPVSSKEGNLILGALLMLGAVGSLVTEIGAFILNNNFERALMHFAFERTIRAVVRELQGRAMQIGEQGSFMARE